jgi:hypothetical protein
MATDPLDFPLVPADDEDITADDELAAAAASALAAGDPVPDEPEDVEPLGRSWLFDFQTRRMVRVGGSPAEVRGMDALKMRCLMALHVERFAHPVFSEDFGFDRLDDIVGMGNVEEAMADYEERFVEALEAVEGVASVQGVELDYDPTTGELHVGNWTIISDQGQALAGEPLTIGLEG